MKTILILTILMVVAGSANANSDVRVGYDRPPKYPVLQSFKCTVDNKEQLLVSEVGYQSNGPFLILKFGAAGKANEILYTKDMYDIRLVSSAKQTYVISIKSENLALHCVQWSTPSHR